MRETTLMLALACAAALGAPAETARAQEWTRFRGPNGTGISETEGLPARWTESDYDWRVELPGVGQSQPVIWGARVFVTSASRDGGGRLVLCLDAADGATVWKREYASRDYRTNSRNSHASSTPVVDAERVYTVFGHPEALTLVALTHTGGEAWKYELGPFASQHGFAASPMIFDGSVVFPCVQGEGGSSFVVALDAASGEVRWRTPRRTVRAAYSTPCVLARAGQAPQLLLTSQAHGISALDARSGKPLWEATVFDKRAVSSPVVAGDLVFGTCGSGGGGNYVAAVRLGGEGDVTTSHAAYRIRQSAPYVPTPVAKDGRVYLWSDRGGIVTCIKAATGEVVWRERTGGNFSGSPIWLENRLYCISDEGEVVVIAAADEFELLARNSLGEPSRSTPAVAGGRLYLRSDRHLIAIARKDAAGAGAR